MAQNGEPSLSAVSKVREMMDHHEYKRALKAIQGHLSQHPKASNVLYRALAALCYCRLEQTKEALEIADTLIQSHPGITDDHALDALTLVYRKLNGLSQLCRLYKGSFEKTRDIRLGELYALVLAAAADYPELQKVSTALFKASQNSKHLLWSIAANALNGANVALVSLSGKMLKKYCADKKFDNFTIVQKQEIALLYLYILRVAGTSFHDIAIDFLDTKIGLPASLGLDLSWCLVTILDEYIDLKLSSADAFAKALVTYLLGNDQVTQDATLSTCINPRDNWKYYDLFLRVAGSVVSESDRRAMDACAWLAETTADTRSPAEFFSAVAPAGSRTRGLALICAASPTTERNSLLNGFIATWASKNAWVCYYDIKTFLTPELLPSLAAHPTLRSQCAAALDPCQTKESLIQQAREIVTTQSKTTHHTSVAATLLLLAQEPWTALALLEQTKEVNNGEPCSTCILLRILITGLLRCLGASTLVPEMALRNIQFDTMHYAYFEGLAQGYHINELLGSCEYAITFYSGSLRGEAYDIITSTFTHCTWHVLTHQLAPTMSKLRLSLHRCECIVLGILAFMEKGNTFNELFQDLKNDLEEVVNLLRTRGVDLCVNDDTSVLEQHVWDYAGITPNVLRKTKDQRRLDVEAVAYPLHAIMNASVTEADIAAVWGTQGERSPSTLDEIVDVVFPRMTLVSLAMRTPAGKRLDKALVASMHRTLTNAGQNLVKLKGEGLGSPAVQPDFGITPENLAKTLKTASENYQGSLGRLSAKVKQRIVEVSHWMSPK